jgi:DNA (cytosine-5)-methyltransferase 1
MENVPSLLRSNQFRLFRRAVEDRGFTVISKVLNAADYGVPQTRQRAFVIGSRLGTPWMPEPTHGSLDNGLAAQVTVRQALSLPTVLPDSPDGSNWHVSRIGILPSSVVRYRAVPPDGGNRFQMQSRLEKVGKGHLVPDCWRNKPTGTTDAFGRLWWDRPAVTIRTEFFKPEKGRYLHPTAHRSITVREAARLQSFPDWFRWPLSQSMTSVARQIGNAVPPTLAFAVAQSVLEHLVEVGVASMRHRRQARQLELVV